MSRRGVIQAAESTQADAVSLRQGVARASHRTAIGRVRRLTGAWVAWRCATRARAHARDRTASLGECAWMLGHAVRLLRSLDWGREEQADTLLGIVLWILDLDLDAPAEHAAYAAWVRQGWPLAGPIPGPHRPSPGRHARWYKRVIVRVRDHLGVAAAQHGWMRSWSRCRRGRAARQHGTRE